MFGYFEHRGVAGEHLSGLRKNQRRTGGYTLGMYYLHTSIGDTDAAELPTARLIPPQNPAGVQVRDRRNEADNHNTASMAWPSQALSGERWIC